ncbi:MAG: hypothetical protein ACREJC_09650, partial [Tepidisphaeraceae bacterium]
SMLVAAIGIGAIMVARVHLRTAGNADDREQARILAQSGLDLARLWVSTDPSWRTTRSQGAWGGATVLGSGSFTISATDPVDGNFANSPLDPLRINALGYRGGARQKLQLTLVPVPVAYSCLGAAMFSAGTLSVSTGIVSTTGLIATNGNVVLASGATIDANAEAVGTMSGANYLGSKNSGVAARTLPDATAFDYYVANGTAISFAATGGDLTGVLLSPANNPFGATDPNGIYVIDCAGGTMRIKSCRVVGTLVILNCKSDSVVDLQVNLAPAVANYPALMVKGSIAFLYTTAALAETTGRNFNPAGTPFGGMSNATTTDTYPSIINGLVYVSENLTMKNSNNVGGPLIVGGTLVSDNAVNVTWDATCLNNPPPGFFSAAPMKVQGGSCKQVLVTEGDLTLP